MKQDKIGGVEGVKGAEQPGHLSEHSFRFLGLPHLAHAVSTCRVATVSCRNLWPEAHYQYTSGEGEGGDRRVNCCTEYSRFLSV